MIMSLKEQLNLSPQGLEATEAIVAIQAHSESGLFGTADSMAAYFGQRFVASVKTRQEYRGQVGAPFTSESVAELAHVYNNAYEMSLLANIVFTSDVLCAETEAAMYQLWLNGDQAERSAYKDALVCILERSAGFSENYSNPGDGAKAMYWLDQWRGHDQLQAHVHAAARVAARQALHAAGISSNPMWTDTNIAIAMIREFLPREKRFSVDEYTLDTGSHHEILALLDSVVVGAGSRRANELKELRTVLAAGAS